MVVYCIAFQGVLHDAVLYCMVCGSRLYYIIVCMVV